MNGRKTVNLWKYIILWYLHVVRILCKFDYQSKKKGKRNRIQRNGKYQKDQKLNPYTRINGECSDFFFVQRKKKNLLPQIFSVECSYFILCIKKNSNKITKYITLSDDDLLLRVSKINRICDRGVSETLNTCAKKKQMECKISCYFSLHINYSV